MTSCQYITLRDSYERTEWHIYTDNQSTIKAINKSPDLGKQIVTNFNDCIDYINDKHPRFRIDIISYYIESIERAASPSRESTRLVHCLLDSLEPVAVR